MYCVVIPTYNNHATIRGVVERSLQQCPDVIVVNDGSTDGTKEILEKIEGIRVVTLAKNSGKGKALKEGLRLALKSGFKYAITLDADGQHYPEDIPLMINASRQHPGALITGSRKDLDSKERSGGSRFANAFSNFWFTVQTLRRLSDTQTGYRLYPLSIFATLSLLTNRYEAELELLVFSAWHGTEIVEQPVRVYYPPREERVSHFRPVRDFSRIFLLNTCLCFLALLYGLPLALLRLLRTVIYTVYSLLFFLFWCVVLLIPASLFVPLLVRDRKARTWMLHRVLHFVGSLVMRWHGIPGVKIDYNSASCDLQFEKPCMVICNHQSSLDLMAMLALSPRVAILTKDWVYHNVFFGRILREGEYYPVTEGMDSLMPKLRSLVERGYSIMVFPEGTRSADLSIQRFHTGAFMIARELGLDILPVTVCAPGKVLPKGGKYLRKGVFHVEVDKRVAPGEYLQRGCDREVARWFRKYYKERYAEISDHILH